MDASFPQKPAYGLGMELAYALGNVVPFVAADFSLQRVGSTGGMGFGSADGFGTVAGGIRVRRPVSRHVVPFAQASIARLRLSAPVYTQPFVGGGLEYSVGHHTALIAGVDLPVAGSSLLDDKPSRLFLGMGWGLGSR